MCSNIETITENNTTNPPIITILEIALEILFERISPKFAKLQSILFSLNEVVVMFDLYGRGLPPTYFSFPKSKNKSNTNASQNMRYE